jgi:hypothetical protein
MPFSDSLLPGGLGPSAVDGVTGARSNGCSDTVPQGPQDDGLGNSPKTASAGARYGAGIWVPPADRSGAWVLIYVNTGNATPNYDG